MAVCALGLVSLVATVWSPVGPPHGDPSERTTRCDAPPAYDNPLGLRSLLLAVRRWFGTPDQDLPELPERPAHLDVLRVTENRLELGHRTILQEPGLGPVTDLHPHGFGGDPCPLVVGKGGAAWLEGDACSRRKIEFPKGGTHVDAVQWIEGGPPEFLSRGNWCCEPFLMDAAGEILWRFESQEHPGVNDTALLRGRDGEISLVLGFNGGGGVIGIGHDGEQIWHREDGNVWHLATLDADGDGRDEIVHSNAAGQLVLRGEHGELVSLGCPAGYFSNFDSLRWNGDPAILHVEDGRLLLLDLDGDTLHELENPSVFRLATPRGAVVKTEQGRWLVSLASGGRGRWDRSVLSVHDEAGQLQFAEILEGSCDAVAAAGPASFWIGCEGAVLAYEQDTQDPIPSVLSSREE